MKFRQMILVLTAIAVGLCTVNAKTTTHSTEIYQQMTSAQRSVFVAEKAERIARQISGRDYEFTPAFEAEIQKALDSYAKRIGNNAGEQMSTGDARFVFERGQSVAPTLINIFKVRKVSPLIGIYIPLVESEYLNLQMPNSVGAIGMFQFLPQTGANFGLTPADLLDVQKSADAAARYIDGAIKTFQDDPMKEALALLAYNRGVKGVERDLEALVNDQNRACSICALTAQSEKLDETFQNENVFYVPRFFAAAIIGENPRAFGLQTPPLSSL